MSLASIGVSRPPATGCAGLPTSGPRSRCTASGGPCGTTPVTLGWCPSGRGRSSWMSPSSRRLGSVPQTLWIRTEPSDRVAHARSTRQTHPGSSRLLDSRQPSSAEVSMRVIGLAVVLAVSLTLASLVAEAQQTGKVYRIGWLAPASLPTTLDAFRGGFRGLGLVGGQNPRTGGRGGQG